PSRRVCEGRREAEEAVGRSEEVPVGVDVNAVPTRAHAERDPHRREPPVHAIGEELVSHRGPRGRHYSVVGLAASPKRCWCISWVSWWMARVRLVFSTSKVS